MSNRNKYLPGLSYGQMGGPMPLSWARTPSREWIKENEPGAGTYTFQIEKSHAGKRATLGRITFWATDLRAAQDHAHEESKKMGGSWFHTVEIVLDEPK